MKKVYTNGWYGVLGNLVYVENGHVVWGLAENKLRTVYVYRKSRFGGYDREYKVTPDALRAGLKRGTMILA